MARMARVVALGIPHHITQRGNRRHDSGNKYGVPGILGAKAERNERCSVLLYSHCSRTD
jgi:hypothetical protein